MTVGEHRTRRGEVFFITAPVEHCAGHGVEKIRDDQGTSAVQRMRLRCCGCGLSLVFTATLRAEPRQVRDAPELPLVAHGAGAVTADPVVVPLPPHRAGVVL